ncbi:sigma 54-interacting transcriptional regulator [Sorangium sp. So ce394]|uniref:sigma 54-interacting transcriptional regulator n=1 Tax=Sorangium sp. So ce394 TaxID=3133310 RepID=UPI003F5BD645
MRRERDLYRKLLELGGNNEIEPFLEEALALIVDIAGARRGYLEIRDDGADAEGTPFWMARGCTEEDVAGVRAAISRGVIAQAIASGQTIVTSSALNDPRFRDRGSVRANRIEAVLCAPIGADPPLGVLYLQDRVQPGPFRDEDRAHVELLARHVATLADRLLLRRRTAESANPTLPLRKKLRADGIRGRSPALARLFQQLVLVAPLEVSVLLTGPTGSGKTAVARVLHDNSPRAGKPFVEINCGALPEALIESELFGAMPGAHSTASRRVPGKVEAAEGGTLFLDEVAELSLTAQAALLQLLQSKEYFPLGGSKAVTADVRIVAATNADLRGAVAKKAFREDLFYRLQVLPVRVPSLAERREDVPELAAHFCEQAVRSYNLPRLELSVGALRAVENAEWPGNIRELAHAVEAAVIRAAADGVLRVEQRHFFPEPEPARGDAGERGDAAERGDWLTGQPTLQAATRAFQARFVRRVLDEGGWNVSEAAARLDIARSHVYNLIRGLGLERPKGV